MVGAPPSTSAADTNSGASGYRALAPALRRVRWPTKFKPDVPEKYDGKLHPSEFLSIYTIAVHAAGGRDDKIMANWFPMALAGEPRSWLLNLPGSTVASWGNSATSSPLTTRCRRTTQSRSC